ncbi:MAG: 30S ribosomal protein S11 [Candidatus Harrisonbacteria bacterium]|nr:30S ribosomal protein S11 [Candidatus Harrisonbacteria bacterium]MBI2405999.1 30S ribosomal protein S11 [Candidatus Harrisonbacteria bacterium]
MGKKKVAQKSGGEGVAAAEPKAAKESAKKYEKGRVYVNASYNNTVISVTDEKGNVLAWGSAGSLGFAGPKKATPFAASKVVAALAEKLKKSGPAQVDVLLNGVGGGRDSAVRSLANQGFNVLSIKDVTPIPHNGPRPPKVRRV